MRRRVQWKAARYVTLAAAATVSLGFHACRESASDAGSPEGVAGSGVMDPQTKQAKTKPRGHVTSVTLEVRAGKPGGLFERVTVRHEAGSSKLVVTRGYRGGKTPPKRIEKPLTQEDAKLVWRIVDKASLRNFKPESPRGKSRAFDLNERLLRVAWKQSGSDEEASHEVTWSGAIANGKGPRQLERTLADLVRRQVESEVKLTLLKP